MILETYFEHLNFYLIILIIALIFFRVFGNRYISTTKIFFWNCFSVILILPVNISFFKFNKKINLNNSNIYILDELINISSVSKQNINLYSNKVINEISFYNKITFFYLITTGFFILLLSKIIYYILFKKRLFQNSYYAKDEKLHLILNKLKLKHNVKAKINIRYSFLINSPLLISCFKPTIFLPYNLNEKYVYYVLEHEILHYKNLDLLFQFIRMIISCLFWYNPIIIFYCKIAEQDMEEACDFRVTQFYDSTQKKKYIEAIYHVATLGNCDNQNNLYTTFYKRCKLLNRMENIMTKRKKRKGIILLVAFIISILFINSTYAITKKEFGSTRIPLESTMKQLDYKISYIDDYNISCTNNDSIINFAFEYNYNLKKNSNTYYATKIGENSFIKVSVLEDINFKIYKKDNNLFINHNNKSIKLDTDSFVKAIELDSKNNISTNKENRFLNLTVIKNNINIEDVNNYSIEQLNFMNYNKDQLSDYIYANYNMSVLDYKKNLIELNQKFPNCNIISYKLLSNNQVLVNLKNDGKLFMELGIEVRNNKVFVEPD